jgi:hypothetical protein
MMSDASDGVMNGLMGSTPITMGGMSTGSSMMTTTAGTSGLASAMETFITSTLNMSGVTTTDMQTLMDHLTSSATGTVQSGGGTMMNGMVSGSVFNGTMSDATVMAYSMTDGAMGAQLASGTTNSMGGFSLSLGAYTGPVMLKMTGGSYEDLSTGMTLTMLSGDVMTCVIPSVSSGASVTGIQMTPLTSMAQAMASNMAGGMTGANIDAANTSVGNYFMVTDILQTMPMNAAELVSGGTTTAMMNYGIAIAAMSQYAQTIGISDPAALITSMMNDASDGIMNGMMGGTSITMGGMGGGMMGGGGTMMQSTAGTSGLAAAMTTFMGSTWNKSGLTETDMQTLVDHLNSSNGTI